MNNSELNTEQLILEAAKTEFFEKGYGNAKMMAIAKRANVAHSMLHYYFRSKENLFQTIFLKQIQTVLPIYESVLEQRLCFTEIVRILMETQFNSMARDIKLSLFILTEILANKENRAMLSEVLTGKGINPFSKMIDIWDEEVKKGAIRPIPFQDFMMMLISINASSFVAMPILEDINGLKEEAIENLLTERRESNIQFILGALQS
ncbi:MAG: TetR/AcrR family transcriptional regulator [Alistipes sp.]|jgi:AcrR family transcriptional regulator|nr:TetR/AcrR family transcriptional regulator [Alistipes sp.]